MDQETSNKTGPKEVFLHLLAIVTLYFSAGSFTALVFQYINLWFPDPLDGYVYYAASYSYGVIRFAISSLIVAFPVYILTSRHLTKLYSVNADARTMGIRKWLIYLTLFLAAMVIIGDLIALVNHLLGGELTTRFIMKVLTVFFVAGSILFYYQWDLKRFKNQS